MILKSQLSSEQPETFQAYVAHLQLHMALQSRNLLPSLTQLGAAGDGRQVLLYQTQAQVEKLISRQLP